MLKLRATITAVCYDNIWYFHGGKENWILLGYDVVFCLTLLPIFQRNSYLHLHSITPKTAAVFFSEMLVTSHDYVRWHKPEALLGIEKRSSSPTSLHQLHDTTIIIITITAYNNNNSVEFNVCLLTCWLNITSAYYKVSTETKIKRKNSVNTQRQNTQETKTIWSEKAI